jgi:hypothetical protein
MAMKAEFLSTEVRGLYFVLHPYAFKKVDDSLQLMSDEVENDPHSPNLINIWALTDEEISLTRTGRILTRDHIKQWSFLIKSLHHGFHKPLRAVSLQLAMPDTEWDEISFQDYRFKEFSSKIDVTLSVAHLNHPTESLFLSSDETPRSLLSLKTIHKLSKQRNWEGWLYYSDWLDSEMNEIFKKFIPDAAEEFQLEAFLKDFTHEIHSSFLCEYRQECVSAMMKLGDLAQEKFPSSPEGLVLEKHFIKMCLELKTALISQCEILRNIERGIKRIEHFHPELIPLKNSVTLLLALLEPQVDLSNKGEPSWTKQLLLFGLLDKNLGVTTCLNSHLGLQRTSLAFAIRISLLQLLKLYPYEEVLSLVLKWDEPTLADSLEKLRHYFRQFVGHNIHHLCIPLTRNLEKKHVSTEGKVGSFFLDALPHELVKLDPKTNLPIELSTRGRQLLQYL